MTDRPPFRNFVLLWLDGRVNYVRYRLPHSQSWLWFMGQDFALTSGRTVGGWVVCEEVPF